MVTTVTACCVSPAKSSSLLPTLTSEAQKHKPINPLLFTNNFFKPISASNTPNPNLSLFRLRISHASTVPSKRWIRLLAVPEMNPEAESSDSNQSASIDIKLPRRRLLVQFTCDDCGERTQRLINPLAYERGLVYVQCAGCSQHHKLVDNLGLVVDYDLREEITVQSNTDQV
ncbi:zf-DNL domain-containing protein [Cephalotus follicularis]|uniref:Zf-DNL domain-containing protein n=1 Tax=Cephalotus follicularis TaxID=3775 RepID=A0A1Q3BZ59_CEPFO|nr:zf-DNL domain-containing protein [Cephalotus follicularis]